MQKDFKRESVRATCMLWIEQAIERANEHGFRVVVASDEEGNNWNELKPKYMEYGGTKDGFIALGVHRAVDEEEVFEDLCSQYPCHELSAVGGMCLEHYQRNRGN